MGKSKADLLAEGLQTQKPVRVKADQKIVDRVTEEESPDVAKVAAIILLAGLASIGIYHLVVAYPTIVKFVGIPLAIALAYIVVRDK